MGNSRLIAFDAVEVRRQCQENRDLALEVYQVVADEVASRLHSTRIRLLDLYSLTMTTPVTTAPAPPSRSDAPPAVPGGRPKGGDRRHGHSRS